MLLCRPAQGFVERAAGCDACCTIRPASGSQGTCGLRYGPCEAAALQERMKRAVALLGEDEVRTILETEGRIEARHLNQAPPRHFGLFNPCMLLVKSWAG